MAEIPNITDPNIILVCRIALDRKKNGKQQIIALLTGLSHGFDGVEIREEGDILYFGEHPMPKPTQTGSIPFVYEALMAPEQHYVDFWQLCLPDPETGFYISCLQAHTILEMVHNTPEKQPITNVVFYTGDQETNVEWTKETCQHTLTTRFLSHNVIRQFRVPNSTPNGILIKYRYYKKQSRPREVQFGAITENG